MRISAQSVVSDIVVRARDVYGNGHQVLVGARIDEGAARVTEIW